MAAHLELVLVLFDFANYTLLYWWCGQVYQGSWHICKSLSSVQLEQTCPDVQVRIQWACRGVACKNSYWAKNRLLVEMSRKEKKRWALSLLQAARCDTKRVTKWQDTAFTLFVESLKILPRLRHESGTVHREAAIVQLTHTMCRTKFNLGLFFCEFFFYILTPLFFTCDRNSTLESSSFLGCQFKVDLQIALRIQFNQNDNRFDICSHYVHLCTLGAPHVT